MSKADEMFEKLGYKKHIEDDNVIYARRSGLGAPKYVLVFELSERTITANDGLLNNRIIDLRLLQAINEKVKELKWNE